MLHRNQRMTNNRKGSEWYDCQRCGEQFPRAQMIIQRGMIVCTVRCVDEPGHVALSEGYPLRTEENVPDLPEDNRDI